jgi:hypothetical protein
MSTTTNLLLATMWLSLSLLMPWAFIPAAACLGCALATAWLGLDYSEAEGE